MAISNAEKQARFRKKEELKKFADTAFREWQIGRGVLSHEDPKIILARLNEAASLPARWNDEHLERAERRIGHLQHDLFGSQYDLKNDVDEAWTSEELIKTPNPGKFIAENKKAVSDTRALASHLLSALELSQHTKADRAAAIMEAMRHVGRALANSSDVARSSANAVCLASLLGHYDRPDWVVETLSKWLARGLDADLARDLGERLIRLATESRP